MQRKMFLILAVPFFLVAAMPASAAWQQTNGPLGGSISNFAVSGPNIFAGSPTGGVYRSTNRGAYWTVLNA